MATEELISADDFCIHHHIEVSFLHSLQDYGLVEMTTIEKTSYLQPAQLSDVEKLVRLHYDLHVNLEGIDVIKNLLDQLNGIRYEMNSLKNKLRFYESE